MTTAQETREKICGMVERFEREVKPMMDVEQYMAAALELELIIRILVSEGGELADMPEEFLQIPPNFRATPQYLWEVPSGINYFTSVILIYQSLARNQRPREDFMENYYGYSAQATMQRPD